MRDLRTEFTAARLGMRAAFVELMHLAERAGVDPEKISPLQYQFWDGNTVVRQNFRIAVLLAESSDRGDQARGVM